MNIIDYMTIGGKNLITEYLDDLPKKEQLKAYQIRQKIMDEGLVALKYLDTRQLRGKLWEIKFFSNRILYVVHDGTAVYFLHVCQKQKNRAEIIDIEKALRRAREFGLKIE